MARHAQLWGGPMDGADVFLGDGPLPQRIGMHETVDGYLVPIRTRALQGELTEEVAARYQHVQLYERVTIDVLRGWRLAAGGRARLFDPTGYQRLDDVPVYVHADLATRWLAQG